jgi:DNA-binding transcriptional LysR family regulator
MIDDLEIVDRPYRNMNQLQAMRVFACVVDLSSFSLAARQLGMSAATVTRSVGALESHLNMRLLHRNTRALSLTEIGKEYLDGCRQIIAKIDEIESNLVEATRNPSGTIRVAASVTFATSELCPLLTAYRTQYPRVDFDVTTFDTRFDMVEGGFDVCFSDERSFGGSTLVSRPLAMVKDTVVATPDYLSRHGVPNSPSALNDHELLAVSDGESRLWEFADTQRAFRVSTGNALKANSCAMVRAAVLQHMGIAILPMPVVSDDVSRGALTPILEQFEVNGGPRRISILYSGRHNLSMKVRSLVDFSVARYQTQSRSSALLAVA